MTEQSIIFGYWSSWSNHRNGNGKYNISEIDPKLFTHLAYALFGMDDNGQVQCLDKCLDLNLNAIGRFVALKEVNKDLKVLAAIGGWHEGSEKYSKMASSSKTRAIFISSIVSFLQFHNFDGFDFMWQYPAQRGGMPNDRENFVYLLKELQAAFKPHNLLLTVSVAASPSIADNSYNIAEMSLFVDLINVMTYDYFTPYDKALGHNAPLYGSEHSVNKSIQYWLAKGAPSSKLVMGIPFFGHTFRRLNKLDTAPSTPCSNLGYPGPYTNEYGYIGYNELCEVFDKWTHIWDASARVFYAYNDEEWLSYDNKQSIEEKIRYMKYNKLVGVNVWSIDLDDFRGISGQCNPLLHTIYDAMHQNN